MLRDRIVCGSIDKKLQHKLLADPTLTFEEALAAAKATEAADQGTKDLSSAHVTVHRVQNRVPGRHKSTSKTTHNPFTSTNRPQTCVRCGADHPATSCKFRNSTCHYCKKQGHLAKVCMKKARDMNSTKPANTHKLTEVTAKDKVEEYALFYSRTSTGDLNPIKVDLTISGAQATMEVDTGATLSLISEETYRSMWPDQTPKLQPSSALLKTYTGECQS